MFLAHCSRAFLISVVAVLALLVADARAQLPTLSEKLIAPEWLLLHDASVQKELSLAPEQKQAIQKEIQAKDPEAPVRVVYQGLDERQNARLAEIYYQLRGGSALALPPVAQHLNLSSEQRRQAEALWRRTNGQLEEQLAAVRFAGKDERQRDRARRQFAAKFLLEKNEDFVEILNKDQLSTLKELTGKPFDVDRIFQ